MRNYVLSSRTSSRRHLAYRAAHQQNVNNVIVHSAIKKSSTFSAALWLNLEYSENQVRKLIKFSNTFHIQWSLQQGDV